MTNANEQLYVKASDDKRQWAIIRKSERLQTSMSNYTEKRAMTNANERLYVKASDYKPQWAIIRKSEQLHTQMNS